MTTKQTTLTEAKPRRLDAFFWAGALIWAGLVFGAGGLGVLPQIGQANTWSWVFLGSGILGLILNFYSQSSMEVSNPTGWDWGWAIVFTLIGAAGFIAFTIPGWLFLIGIGAAILVSALQRSE